MRAVLVSPARDRVAIVDAVIVVDEVVPVDVVYVAVVVVHAGARDLPGVGLNIVPGPGWFISTPLVYNHDHPGAPGRGVSGLERICVLIRRADGLARIVHDLHLVEERVVGD
jgi:hypothetical protein